MPSNGFFVRDLHPGMGQAVAERTVLRKKEDGSFETWGDVAQRVAYGNSLLHGTGARDRDDLERLIASGALLMSGRHLQHGDYMQPSRNQEIFTNCATSPTSFSLFLHLLNGSGVGRCYDDDMLVVNWDDAPTVWCVLDEDHPDYVAGQHMSARDARHMFKNSRDMMWFEVPDDREGWGKALELVEVAAFERVHKDKLLVLDFSRVRAKDTPIKGMQGRPASGPVPLMNAFDKAMQVRGSGIPRWRQAMYVDHFFAECVLVGGARRAARIAVMDWRSEHVIDFIEVKRPIEFQDMSMEDVIEYREYSGTPRGFLWTSNNSIAVDAEFWEQKDKPGSWAYKVFQRATECAYADGTGEPGFLNVDRLTRNDEGWDDLHRGDYVGSQKFQCQDNTHVMLARLAKRAKVKTYNMIVNPCGEVALCVLGGYCVIGDVAPYHCWLESEEDEQRVPLCFEDLQFWDDNFEEAVRATVRALMRVNLMDSVYAKEVKRTNRIGVSLTGIHEWMWARFGLGFRDALDRQNKDARLMWETLAHMSRAVRDESEKYAAELGVAVPHTCTTIKPAGTTSKLFGLTEGAHLPAMAHYLRWVQFRNDDPLVDDYKAKGYPVRVLEQYKGHTIVGFPTEPVVASLIPEDKLVTAAQATMDEQYLWLALLEEYWIEGGLSGEPYGNQVSYTLKYDPEAVSYERFREEVSRWQPMVRACSVMPQEDCTAYEYQPEQPVSREEFDEIVSRIERAAEEVGQQHLGCENGACPVEWNQEKGQVHEPGYA